MRNCIWYLLLLLLSHKPLLAQRPDSVYQLLDSALNVMEHRSFYSRNVPWGQVRDSVFKMTAGATTYAEALPALAYAFDRLGDKHGWLEIGGATHYNKQVDRSGAGEPSAAIKEVLAKGPRIYNGVISGKYAYVNIHFFGGQTEEAMNHYAQQIQDSLCKNVSAATRGIILDLRLNGGGNVYPMYQGVANVLGNRKLSEGVDGRGNVTGAFIIRNGRVTLYGNYGDSLVLHLKRQCGDLANLPVAVLIGPVSGSAAEQVAIAFTSRPNTVLIGERTAGFVTANNGFQLPGNGNAIVLAEGLSRNINGKLFDEAVLPEIEVTGGDNFINRDQDAKIRAAVQWLQQKRR